VFGVAGPVKGREILVGGIEKYRCNLLIYSMLWFFYWTKREAMINPLKREGRRGQRTGRRKK
jgi:hypothetical protein